MKGGSNIVELRMGFDVYSDEIRAALDKLGMGQREAARFLQVQEREFRGWCAGRPCPRAVLLALHYLIEHPDMKGKSQ